MLYMIKFFIMLMLTMMMIINILNKMNIKKNKINNLFSIECGFNNTNNKHIPLYMNFFFIMLIFMIFDLEFFLIIPLIMIIKFMNWIKMMMMMMITLMFIYISLMYEIKFNSIKWIK